MSNRDFSELKKNIEINSWTKNKSGVDINGNIFGDWLCELELERIVYEREDIGNHLHFKSKKRDGKKLLLLGHLDTVFPPDTFEEFREDEEWIYGAGVCDMKGGNFVALEALRNIYKSKGEIYNIDFLLVSDEETGSDDSKLLSAKVAEDYDYCMVFEASGVNEEVVVARKGVGTFFIDIIGEASHAGNHYSDGADANLEASYKLQALVALTDLDMGTTVNVGKMSGGIGANTISPKAHLTFELRYRDIREKERVLESVYNIVSKSFVDGTSATLSGGIQRDVMQPSKAQEDFIERIEILCGVSLPTEHRGGVSDANIISSKGVITLDGFGPYGDGDHTIDERASKETFDSRIELVTDIFGYLMENRI